MTQVHLNLWNYLKARNNIKIAIKDHFIHLNAMNASKRYWNNYHNRFYCFYSVKSYNERKKFKAFKWFKRGYSFSFDPLECFEPRSKNAKMLYTLSYWYKLIWTTAKNVEIFDSTSCESKIWSFELLSILNGPAQRYNDWIISNCISNLKWYSPSIWTIWMLWTASKTVIIFDIETNLN